MRRRARLRPGRARSDTARSLNSNPPSATASSNRRPSPVLIRRPPRSNMSARCCIDSSLSAAIARACTDGPPSSLGQVSEWFQNYGFAEVFPELMIGAYPLDAADVDELAACGVRRVLNLAQDAEYDEVQRDRGRGGARPARNHGGPAEHRRLRSSARGAARPGGQHGRGLDGRMRAQLRALPRGLAALGLGRGGRGRRLQRRRHLDGAGLGPLTQVDGEPAPAPARRPARLVVDPRPSAGRGAFGRRSTAAAVG